MMTTVVAHIVFALKSPKQHAFVCSSAATGLRVLTGMSVVREKLVFSH